MYISLLHPSSLEGCSTTTAAAILSAIKSRGNMIRFRRSGQSAAEPELGWDAFDAVGGVDIFDEGDLKAGGGALAGDDGGVGEEEFPDLVWVRSGYRKRHVFL
jgi:hypothetical protein